MSEKEKYLDLYNHHDDVPGAGDILPGKMGGGYGRICWGENMLETLKEWRVSSLLDVGCGYGNFCDAATLFVPRVYGLDIASVASGNVISNSRITYLDGEASHLPLEPESVEWITCFDCLEHCLEQDIDHILSEFDRVASKGFALSISYEPCEQDGVPLHMTVRPEAWWIEKLSRYGTVNKEGRAPITGAPYLICRKPVHRRIIAYCAGGLGIRLRTLARADAFARQTRRELVMLWLRDDPLCRVAFTDLFDNAIGKISESQLMNLPGCRIYARIKSVADQALISGGSVLRQAVTQWGCADPSCLTTDDPEENLLIFAPESGVWPEEFRDLDLIRRLKPKDSILSRIAELKAGLGIDRRCMGVHARGSDFGVSVDAYDQQIRIAIRRNPNQKFLVVSEDESYETILHRRHRQQVILRPKSSRIQRKDIHRPWTIDNIETSRESMVEMLIDLHLLAHTDFRIYHESSATAQLGVELARVHGSAAATLGFPDPSDPRDRSLRRTAAGHGKSQGDATPSTADTSPAVECGATPTTVYYACPDLEIPSAGIRRLYRHVVMLNHSGLRAFILHTRDGFSVSDMPKAPIRYLNRLDADRHAIFVIPESMPGMMLRLKDHPGRRFCIALNWHYVFSVLPDGLDWRQLNIERVMVVSPVIGRMITWSMGLPVHQLGSSIDHGLYYFDPGCKQPRIVYIRRKAKHIDVLKRLLAARDPAFVRRIRWEDLHGLSVSQYASRIREASIFLNLSTAEGLPTSCLEAMAAGTLVAGYDSVGGRGLLRGRGAGQNCIVAPMGDYTSLAYALEPVLDALIHGQIRSWETLLSNGVRTAAEFTLDSENAALMAFWKDAIAGENALAA